MNILYCGDENIQDGVLISVLSLLEHVREPLHIYLLTAKVQTEARLFRPLPSAFASFLSDLVKQGHPESTACLFDITKDFADYLPSANLDTRFTPCCMLRLYADKVQGLPEKLLYLDNDVVCHRDPSDFYYQDLTFWELAGCLDYYGSWFLRKHLFKRDYVNSGVLLLNMSAIQETALFENCRRLCRDEQMFMPDQSALNRLCCRKKLCPRRYNEQKALRRDTVFRHFTTFFRFFPWFHAVSVKPWDIQGMHETLKTHEYDALFDRYQHCMQQYHEQGVCL